VAIETEIKLEMRDLEAFRRKLAALQPVVRAPRHFEENFVLDTPERTIRSAGCVVRIRIASGAAILTYKGPARAGGPFKSREELETALGDGGAALEIFRRLGMSVWFRYQKYREEYALAADASRNEVLVSLDETPIGRFAELEGDEEAIRRVAAALGYDERSFVRDSYYALHARACAERGAPVGDMVFEGRGV
jgi:adenylate cyclase class 2